MVGRLRHIGVCLLIALSHGLFAQQNWMYNNHQFNAFDVIHAHAGAYGDVAAALRYRNQWIGLDGAPETITVSAHFPLTNSLNGGVFLRSESLGSSRWMQAKAVVAYGLNLGRQKLSFSLNPVLWTQSLNPALVLAQDASDPIFTGTNRWSTLSADFSVMYRSPLWIAGAQINNLTGPSPDYGTAFSGRYNTFVSLLAARSFVMKNRDVIKPVVFMRATSGLPLSVDVSLQYFWREKLWLGAGYRTGAQFFALLEYQLNDQFRFGYSYDLFGMDVFANSGGSHELFLGWSFRGKGNESPSMRYFR